MCTRLPGKVCASTPPMGDLVDVARQHDAQFRLRVQHVILVAVHVLVDVFRKALGVLLTHVLNFLLAARGAGRGQQGL